MKERRVGKFKLDDRLVLDYEVSQLVFGAMGFVCTRCEHDYLTRQFEYRGFSPLFDITPVEFEIPEYEIKFNGSNVTAERKQDHGH